MARIREALWKVDGAHASAHEPAPPTCPAPAMNAPVADENDVPFIEVGGPHKLVEGSPSVMAVAPPAMATNKVTATPAHSESASVVVVESVRKAVNVVQSVRKAVNVAFRPLHQTEASLAPVAERFARELVAFHQPEDALSEQYRSLVRELTAQAAPVKPHVLLVAPATRSYEPTALVLNVAITKAREGNVSVIVVDAELQQPALAQLLGLPASPGLCEILSGTSSLQRAVRETGLTGLHALTAGRLDEEAPAFLAGDAMRAVLRHLRARFGWVLIRAPLWDGRTDLVSLGSACDTAYLVLAEAETREPRVQELLRAIPRQGIPLRGCIYAGN